MGHMGYKNSTPWLERIDIIILSSINMTSSKKSSASFVNSSPHESSWNKKGNMLKRPSSLSFNAFKRFNQNHVNFKMLNLDIMNNQHI